MNTKCIMAASSLALFMCFSTASGATDKTAGQESYGHGGESDLPKGVIGVSLDVGAERIGDPAVLYVAMVHPEGPAHRAGLTHGDEIVTVDGTAVAGKTYEQVVRMIRGEAGATVKLGVKGDGAVREIAVTRVASDKLPKPPMGSHGSTK